MSRPLGLSAPSTTSQATCRAPTAGRALCARGTRTAAAAAARRQPRLCTAAALSHPSAEGSLDSTTSTPYAEALTASLSRTTLHWQDLLTEVSGSTAGSSTSGREAARLQRLRQRLHGSAAFERLHVADYDGEEEEEEDRLRRERQERLVEDTLEEWAAVAHQRPPGFDNQDRLAAAGVADVAVVSRGGRTNGYWKGVNQDSCSVSAPAPGALLLTICDGHGRRGEQASRVAAQGLSTVMPELLADAASSSGDSGSEDGSGSGAAAGSGMPAAQRALVAAFEAVAGGMQQLPAFRECGTAVAACLLQRDSVTVAWAGDCRAVVGLAVGTADGARCLVHPLTRDHKPSSPAEQARIAASGRGRVVQTRPGQPHRITGSRAHPTTNSLSVSRSFGDAWAVPLGFTAEPDAVTLTLPPPSGFVASSGGSPLATVGSSYDADDSSSGSATAMPARHVLVVACDGLWDMLSNEEAVSIALSCESSEAAAHAVVDVARRRWAAAHCGLHMDDITAAVAFLPC